MLQIASGAETIAIEMGTPDRKAGAQSFRSLLHNSEGRVRKIAGIPDKVMQATKAWRLLLQSRAHVGVAHLVVTEKNVFQHLMVHLHD